MYFKYDMCYTKYENMLWFNYSSKFCMEGDRGRKLCKLILIISWFVELYWQIKELYVCLKLDLKVKILIYLIFASTLLLTNVLAKKICLFMLFHDYANLEFDVRTELLPFLFFSYWFYNHYITNINSYNCSQHILTT